MKKALVVCGLALLSFIPASAQFSYGIRGGLNLVNNNITNVDQNSTMNKDNYTGFFIGPMIELQVPIVGIGVDASVLYSQKGLKVSQDEDIKNQAIAVPVSLKYTLGLGNFAGVFVAAGPEFDYKIGELEYEFTSTTEAKQFALEKSTWSINIGAGVKLINHIQAGVNYNIPVSKEGAYTHVEAENPLSVLHAAQGASESIKSSTLQFSLTWTF